MNRPFIRVWSQLMDKWVIFQGPPEVDLKAKDV